ncbi:MAG: glycosyltransferase [Flavobacteriaceae bacterium]|nr:glycosyltransferase [Flavobacteriaceae bacterium]
MPKVSIIVPNYNHASFLKERLDAVFNQTFQDFEVILLDDASTDNSVSILNEYAKDKRVTHFIINKKNSGSPFKQWKKALELAQGDYIWIAETDDYSSTMFLSKVMEAFNHSSNPDIVFVGTTNVNEFNEGIGNSSRIERKYKDLFSKNFNIEGKVFLEKFLPNFCVIRNMSSAVFKKSVGTLGVKNVEEFKVIGDFYFWVYLCSINCNFFYLSEKLNFMRNHSKTVRRNKSLSLLKDKEYKKIHKEVVRRNVFNFKVLSILVKYYIKKKIV